MFTVTEHEVYSGILSVDDIEDKVLCFERIFIDLNLKDSIAGRFNPKVNNEMYSV